MISPETLDALSQALDAVVQEAGNDPQYADLTAALSSAQDALHQIQGAGDVAPAAPPTGDQSSPSFDAGSFDHAQAAMTKRRKDTKGGQA